MARPREPAPARTRPRDEPRTISLLEALGVAVGGLALGLGATALLLMRGFDPGAVRLGPWLTQPGIGTPDIDPYALAQVAMRGISPLAAAEGLRFRATTDDTGFQLVLECSYRLSGPIGPGRFWTLTVTDAAGHRMETAAERTAFTSASVLRDASGSATIEIGPAPRPGNWLPTSGHGPMTIDLRLYDTPLSDARANLAVATLPALTRVGCEGASSGPQR